MAVIKVFWAVNIVDTFKSFEYLRGHSSGAVMRIMGWHPTS